MTRPETRVLVRLIPTSDRACSIHVKPNALVGLINLSLLRLRLPILDLLSPDLIVLGRIVLNRMIMTLIVMLSRLFC